MKKIFSILMVLLLIVVLNPTQANSGLFGKKSKAKAKTSATADSTKKASVSKYDKLFKGKSVETSKSSFITLHKFQGGKLYVELPVKYLGREMMLASTVSEVSNGNYAAVGYKPKDPVHFKFTMGDSIILMNKVNSEFTFNQKEPNLEKAMKINSMDPIIGSFKIAAFSKDSSAVVFDMTSIFDTNHALVAPMGNSGGVISVQASFNSAGSFINGIKAFEDNAVVKSTLSYSVSMTMLGMYLIKKDDPFTLTATRTILLLPDQKMRPRIADSRLGIFLSNKTHVSTEHDQIKSYSVSHRWNLEPKDIEAYKKGELVEPIKPIVFYVDDAFPVLWKESVKQGALRWNAAFEKIGFKNAIQVQDFPQNDPNFDPDNLKYSCIRYIPNTVSNAMGPSWVDPTSGEIINASVLIFNDVIKLINQWRFVQTAQVDERVRNKKMPEDVVKESIEYIVAHEVGHCLGFMHNMAASAAYKVDSLRSASFTQKYGTTASIMDYARYNYVAQPSDKGVKLTPPDLGAYDYFLVKWLYQPMPDVATAVEEIPTLEKMLDEKAGDPIFRYGKQQFTRYDPSAIEEDLGDDAIKAGDYGIKNLKFINANLNKWITNDDDVAYREMTYNNIGNQYYRYVKNVMMNIGGIYLTTVKDGTAGESVVSVPKELQKRSLLWCVEQLRNSQWIENKDLTDKMQLRVSLVPIMQYYPARELMDTYKNVVLSSHISKNPYTIEEYTNDLYNAVWAPTIKGQKLQDGDKTLQSLLVEIMNGAATKVTNLVKIGLTSTTDLAHLPSVDEMALYGLDQSGLVSQYADQLREIDAQYGRGYVASQMIEQNQIGSGYNWQYRVNTRTIDNSKACFHAMLLKTKRLLETRIPNTAVAADKAHYQSLLFDVERALRKQ